jgi:branched-chain amino acid transport system ATP-binding protein
MSLLHIDGLYAGYGPITVLHGLSLTVSDGEVVVVLGANGAGKTTLMRAVSGTINRTGEIAFDGRSIGTAAPDSILRRGVAHVPQGRGTFADLTVEENLRVGGHVRRVKEVDADIDRWFTTFPRLAERRQQRAGGLSGGEQQMLAISRALMSRPRLLLCDEPSLGLAPLIIEGLFEQLAALSREEGLAVLLVEQNAQLAMDIADRVYLLETGRLVASGTSAEMSADESIRKAYLGY